MTLSRHETGSKLLTGIRQVVTPQNESVWGLLVVYFDAFSCQKASIETFQFPRKRTKKGPISHRNQAFSALQLGC
jgi:hypothetical protein